MLLSIPIELLLNKASEVRAKYTSFMSWVVRTVIAYGWVLAKGDTNRNYLHKKLKIILSKGS